MESVWLCVGMEGLLRFWDFFECRNVGIFANANANYKTVCAGESAR